MTPREAARIINAFKCSMVTTLEENEALAMAECVLCEQERKNASVDAPIKHGVWTAWDDAGYAGGGYYKCSVCGYRFSFAAFVDLDEHGYCPHCGARLSNVHCDTCIHYEVCGNASMYTDAKECKHYKADDSVHTNPEDSIREDRP